MILHIASHAQKYLFHNNGDLPPSSIPSILLKDAFLMELFILAEDERERERESMLLSETPLR